MATGITFTISLGMIIICGLVTNSMFNDINSLYEEVMDDMAEFNVGETFGIFQIWPI